MPQPSARRLLAVVSAVLATVSGACGESAPAPAAVVVPAPTVRTVIVDVDSTVMTVGGKSAARAQALDGAGYPMTGKTATWSSANPAIASVTSGGQVTAVGAGITKIIATIDGVTGDRDIVIRGLAPVDLIDVSMRKSALTVGDTVTATALLFDSLGNRLTGRAIAWSIVGSPTVATVSAAGLVTAIASGSATLVATADSARGTFDFSVAALPPKNAVVASVAITIPSRTLRVGEAAQASADALDSAGTVIPGKAVTWSVASGAGVVTVSTSGLVTAVQPGSAQLTATIDGVRGATSLTVIDSTRTPGGGAVIVPTLPETLSFSFPTVSGKRWDVRAGDNLQTVLNSASRGDEIVLQAGATFTGNFTLPQKPGTPADGWIVIRSDQLGALPPAGVRVTPTFTAMMPKVVSASTSAALSTNANASGWWIAGVEFTIAPTVTQVVGRVVALGSSGGAQNSLAQVPTDLVLDRVYIHPQPTQHIQRCLELNSARTSIQDSYLMDCHAKGYDSQAIVLWNGPGPFRIVNNTLAGAGENIMFGGADPSIPNLIPSDIVVARNYIYTPVSWKGVWTKKNLFETKNVQRVLVEGNVLDGSWTDGQVGYAFLLKVANQSGRCTWCTSRDITIRDNLVRNAGGAFGITGKEGGNTNPIGELINRLLIENNIAENINVAPFTGDARLVSIMQNAQNVTIRRNTMTAPASLSQFLNLGTIPASTNFAFDNNVVSYGTYGLFSSKYGIGEVSLQGFAGTVSFVGNVIVGPQKSGYPNAQFVSSLSLALQRGAGANKASIDLATQNVIIP